jgi:hypothetical protein
MDDRHFSYMRKMQKKRKTLTPDVEDDRSALQGKGENV